MGLKVALLPKIFFVSSVCIGWAFPKQQEITEKLLDNSFMMCKERGDIAHKPLNFSNGTISHENLQTEELTASEKGRPHFFNFPMPVSSSYPFSCCLSDFYSIHLNSLNQ